jgi:flagellin
MTVRNQLNAASMMSRLAVNNNQVNNSSRNLASGLRVNRAADDAAGLAISMKMQTRIESTHQAIRNANDGISLVQTAEGALEGTHAMLGRLQILSVQAANGTLNDTQRSFIQMEVDNIMSEINRTAESTDFNGIRMLNGSLSGDGALSLQVGAQNGEQVEIDIEIDAMTTAGLGLAGNNVSTQQAARDSIGTSHDAIALVSAQRANLGAVQNRLEHTVNSLITTNENMTAANSRIVDADMAREMINHTRDNILQQSSIALLAHSFNKVAEGGIWAIMNQGATNFNA